METGNPTNLHEQTYQNLKTMIVEGAIAPGSKLNERALAETLSVSRTPIREAIRRLAAAGLVELINNRGAIVPKLNKEDVLNAFELMAELEGFSGELAAKRINKEALSEIEALHYEMLACYSRKDLSGYYKLNSQIHQHINLAAGNPVLTNAYSQVNARIQALRFRSNQDQTKWDEAVLEHGEMIAALKAADSQRMRKVLMQHLANKKNAILTFLETQ